jgi:hypothetical protein
MGTKNNVDDFNADIPFHPLLANQDSGSMTPSNMALLPQGSIARAMGQ